MGLNGYDEASYQNGLRESNVPGDFVIIKVSEGTGYENPGWKEDIKEALSSNKLVGLYHYAKGLDAESEAKYFYNKIKDYVGKSIFALDWEAGGNSAFGKTDVSWCKKFLDKFYDLSGNRPLIYMSTSVTNAHDWSSVAKNYKLWLANYGTNPVQYGYKTASNLIIPNCGAWGKNVTIYQYSSKGRLASWNSYLDLNYAYLTKKEWEDFQKTSTVQTKTETTKYYRDTVVKIMQGWIGLKDSDNSHKPIIDIYNTISPLPVGFKMTTNLAWCATTVSAAFKKAGYSSIFPSECSCPRMITKAQEMGIWIEDDKYVPNPGDCVLYDWQDGSNYATTDNKGTADHIGMVEKVSGNTITVIEGNMGSGYVGRRNLSVNGRYIRGFVCPKFSSTITTVTTSTPTVSANSITKGASGDAVKLLQTMLIACGYSCGSAGADGKFGDKTLSALKKFQTDNNLKVDGIYGSISKNKLVAKYEEALKAKVVNKLKATSTSLYAISGRTTPNKDNVVISGKVVNAPDGLRVRSGAGTNYSTCSFSPLKNGNIVEIFDAKLSTANAPWYYIRYNGKFGFVHSAYISK